MPYIPNTLSPTPDRGDAWTGLFQAGLTRERAGAQTVAASIGGGKIYNTTGRDVVLTNVDLRVGTAPTGADLIVDVNTGAAGGAATSAFEPTSTRPKIVAGQFTGSAAPRRGTLADPVEVVLKHGEWITVDVDQIGSAVAGSDLVVTVYGRPVPDDSAAATGPGTPGFEPYVDI